MNRRLLLRAATALAASATVAGCGLFDEDKKPITPGRRIDILPTTTRLVPDPALSGRPVLLPAGNGGGVWEQPGRVPSHVSANPDWSGSDRIAWSTPIGAGQGFRSRLTASPIVAGGRVFTMDADANVAAFDLGSGRPVWHVASRQKKVRSSNVGGGITYADGVVFAVSGLADALAIDAATGHVRWRITTVVPARSAPTVVDGRVFFGTIDQRLFAVDAATGKPLWSFQAQSSFDTLLGQPAPAVVGDTVIAGFGSGEIAVVNAVDGSVIWTDVLGGLAAASPLAFSSIFGEPVVTDDTVYAISADGLITATDLRTGRRVWERPVGGIESPAVTEDWVFILTSDQTVACLDRAAGHVRWTSVLPRYLRPNTEKQPILWSGPLLAGGRLVLVSDRGTLVAIDPSEGVIVADRKIRGPASNPPIAAGGFLFVLTDDGRLTAYR